MDLEKNTTNSKNGTNMRISIYLSRLICLLFIINAYQSSAQLSKPFTLRYQSYVKGDMTILANNIVNRKEKFSGTNEPYNSVEIRSKLNDEFYMDYIDIDDDKTTFSSSSAEFKLEESTNAKIVYAGLYWSATYKFNKGKQKRNRKFRAIDKNRESIEFVKLKLPNQSTYTDIKGEVIFDGLNNSAFEENAPYAVYADITKELKNLENPTGVFTVANVRSTIGTLSGGVSAGWTMIIVYEDVRLTGKFITSYDGFAGVTKKSTEINFTGFQTLPEGKVNAKVAGAGLEGDLGLRGDQFEFKAEGNLMFTTLNNSLRDFNNFFNSSITIGNDYFNDRTPNSLNTLGYDSFLIKIHNPENSVIGNNTREAKLRLKSSGDRYFMFFCALNVEVFEPVEDINEIIQKPLIVDNSNEPSISASIEIPKTLIENDTIETTNLVESNKKEVLNENNTKDITIIDVKTLSVTTKTTEKVVAKAQKPVTTQKPTQKQIVASTSKTETKPVEKLEKVRVTPIESASRVFPGKEKGYYIIANVFAVHKNATRFVETLKNKGIDAAFFINPANNYRYVYVSHHENFSDAQSLYFSNINNKYQGDLWIMTVNKENDMIVENKIQKATSEDNKVVLPSNTNNYKSLICINLNTVNNNNYIADLYCDLNENKFI